MAQLTVDVQLPAGALARRLAADAHASLTADPKWLMPVWFYDERGSSLFDEITRLPEYYLTRAERAILSAHAGDIADAAGADVLVELGSGTSEKTRVLLDAMAARSLRRFVPLDVSEETLRHASAAIAATYGIEVNAVVGDFEDHLDRIPRGGRRLVAFLGSTIGNFTPDARRRFLVQLRAELQEVDHFLLGTDLVKDPARLLAAYDDPAGVTAEFNRNALRVLNHELGADFDPDAFEHVARWDSDNLWVDIRLRSLRNQVVDLAELAMIVPFRAGEEMRTEISTKFARQGLEGIYAEAGLELTDWWTDPEGLYALSLARAV